MHDNLYITHHKWNGSSKLEERMETTNDPDWKQKEAVTVTPCSRGSVPEAYESTTQWQLVEEKCCPTCSGPMRHGLGWRQDRSAGQQPSVCR